MTERAFDVEGRLSRLEERMKNVSEDFTEMKADLRAIRDVVVAGKGSWKLVVALAGVSSTVAGGLAYLGGFLHFKP